MMAENKGVMDKYKRQTARRAAKSGRSRTVSGARERRDPIATEISELVPVLFMGRSILVVEADPEVQAGLARGLSRRGHRVVGTGSGDGALALVSQWDVDLVLISDTLPGRSGVEVVRAVHQVRPHAVIVLMSDNLEPAILLAASGAGAAQCVRKPLGEEELGQLLRMRPEHQDRGAVAQ
jgi:CheY-like chemotaxis protein